MLYPDELRAHMIFTKRGHGLRSGRGREIRTPDPLVPNQMRYQTALCPDLIREVIPEEGEIIRG